MTTNGLTLCEIEDANDLIDSIDDAVSDLSHFSVRNGDVFNYEVSKFEELVKECRKVLI